ncbi:MAG: hypothetical protein L6R39_004238 [Caloplaca ligustica]|nr:MAG: hypothetical protein L6R39_004238 [Caloplaca ligustica]
MNPAMRSQYHNIHHPNAPTPHTRRSGVPQQAQREAQTRQRQQQERQAEAREKEMAQRRTNKPADKNMPDGIDELIIGDGVQLYKRMRDVERRLDATMMRKRLDFQDPRYNVSKRYKKMRIWISNTVDFPKGEEQDLYDFSGNSECTYRMKIEGRLLDDKDDDLRDDDDSDDEKEEKDGDAMDQDDQLSRKPVKAVGPRPTKLSHFFKAITIEFDRNKDFQADYTTQIDWKRPSPTAPGYPDGTDFDSLEFERKADSDMNCTINFYRDDNRFLLSDPLAELLDSRKEDRKSVIIGIWDYIKAMNLQQDDEKRAVQCDERLRRVSSALYPDPLIQFLPHLAVASR